MLQNSDKFRTSSGLIANGFPSQNKSEILKAVAEIWFPSTCSLSKEPWHWMLSHIGVADSWKSYLSWLSLGFEPHYSVSPRWHTHIQDFHPTTATSQWVSIYQIKQQFQVFTTQLYLLKGAHTCSLTWCMSPHCFSWHRGNLSFFSRRCSPRQNWLINQSE